jgi:hypothetical protein
MEERQSELRERLRSRTDMTEDQINAFLAYLASSKPTSKRPEKTRQKITLRGLFGMTLYFTPVLLIIAFWLGSALADNSEVWTVVRNVSGILLGLLVLLIVVSWVAQWWKENVSEPRKAWENARYRWLCLGCGAEWYYTGGDPPTCSRCRVGGKVIKVLN